MEFVRILFVLVEALVCLMLIGIILLQKSKNEGMGLAFGSGMGESLFGARAGNVLTRATIVLGIVFLLNTLWLGILFAKQEKSLADSVVVENTAVTQPVVPATQEPVAIETAPVVAEDAAIDMSVEEAPITETDEEM